MSETTPNAKGPAPYQGTPEAAQPAPIPADQVKPEDIGKLSIEYRDGHPVIIVSGGTVIPEKIAVVDASGNPDVQFQIVARRVIDASAFNQYTFSRNDPVNFVDMDGN